MAAQPKTFPLYFWVDYPRASSRLLALLRLPLLVPYYILGLLVGFLFFFVVVSCWLAVVITGRIPRSLFGWAVVILRWQAGYSSFLYLLSDRFAPLDFGKSNQSGVHLEIEIPASSSRLLAFARAITIIPGALAFCFVSLASYALLPISWLAIVITGRHPDWLFRFHEGTIRWDLRLLAYLYMLRDEYPPYSMRHDAPVSSNLVAFILGITMIGVILLVFSALAESGSSSRRLFESDEDWEHRKEQEDEQRERAERIKRDAEERERRERGW